MTNSLLLRVVNKHRSVHLHPARGTKLCKTTGKNIDTDTLNMRYSAY